MSPALAKLLRRAALLLEEDAAASLVSCHTIRGPWTCSDCSGFCDSHRSYDERIAAAKALRAEAA